MMAGPDDWSP